jgi:hypothetical protein
MSWDLLEEEPLTVTLPEEFECPILLWQGKGSVRPARTPRQCKQPHILLDAGTGYAMLSGCFEGRTRRT